MKKIRVAIAGTYSTGKSTVSEALSLYTGMPKTDAKTMREILPDVFPGKMLEECTPRELGQLGLLRFRERIRNEGMLQGSFISDGSCLHEWVYGKGRLSYGMTPDNSYLRSRVKSLLAHGMSAKSVHFLEIYGDAAKYHAKHSYDVFIHMPIEFPIVEDGHRPMSDAYRRHTERLLLATLAEIGMRHHAVSGSVEERITKIAALLGLPTVMPAKEAAKRGTEIIHGRVLEIEEKRRRDVEAYRRKHSAFQRFLHKVA